MSDRIVSFRISEEEEVWLSDYLEKLKFNLYDLKNPGGLMTASSLMRELLEALREQRLFVFADPSSFPSRESVLVCLNPKTKEIP